MKLVDQETAYINLAIAIEMQWRRDGEPDDWSEEQKAIVDGIIHIDKERKYDRCG